MFETMTSPELIDGRMRGRKMRAPSIVCDVELYVCDAADLASECAYVAGDPINLRDPWGLTIEERGVESADSTCGKEGAASPCPIVPDAEPTPPAPAKIDEPMTPDEACDARCREIREGNKRNRELVERNSDEHGENQQRDREAAAARPAPAAPGWFDQAVTFIKAGREAAAAAFGGAAEDGVARGVHAVGLPQTSFGGAKKIGAAASHLPEVVATYGAGKVLELVVAGAIFPGTRELAKRYAITEREIHSVKESILKDLGAADSPWKDALKRLGRNPDIGISDKGNVALKIRVDGVILETDIPVSAYGGVP